MTTATHAVETSLEANGRILQYPRTVSGQETALTELGLARRMVAAFDGTIRYAPQLRAWLVWDGRRWAEDITGEVNRRAKKTVDALHEEARTTPDRRDALVKAWLRLQTASHIRAIVNLAETEPDVAVTVEELDADPWALNVANGILDLRNGELRSHDPAEMHTKLIEVPYDPDATAPTWERFLLEVFANDVELISFIQRFAGYSLSGDVSEHLLVFGYGSGANGKSTLLGMLRRLTGNYGLQLDPTILTSSDHDRHPTGLTDLRGARLVTTVETEANRQLAEVLVKMLTGGDPIRARRMRGDYFEFQPTATFWLAGNHLPTIRGTDLGIWRRIALVPFEVTFEGDRQDRQLPEKLVAEAPGILAWAVRGCLGWRKDGLRVPERVKAATHQYRTAQDHVGRFLTDCCAVAGDARVSAADLRAVYEEWCKQEGEQAWSQKAVGAELKDRGFSNHQVGTARVRTWLGVGLRKGERV